jgi:hypothetical protein
MQTLGHLRLAVAGTATNIITRPYRPRLNDNDRGRTGRG